MNSNSGYNSHIYRYNFTHDQMLYYFRRPPKHPIKLLLFTLILSLLGTLTALTLLILLFMRMPVPSSNNSLIVYIIMLIMGIVLIVCITLGYFMAMQLHSEWAAYSKEKRNLPPNEQQYQAWLDERCDRFHDKVLQKLRGEDIKCTLKLVGSILPPAEEHPLVRECQNGGVHSSINICMSIFLTEDTMKVFSSKIDALTFDHGRRVEGSSHYFYGHITSTSLDTTGLIIPVENSPYPVRLDHHYFSFASDNGDLVRLGVTGASLQTPQSNFNTVEGVFDNFLSQLREHNFSRVRAYQEAEAVKK